MVCFVSVIETFCNSDLFAAHALRTVRASVFEFAADALNRSGFSISSPWVLYGLGNYVTYSWDTTLAPDIKVQ